jgi:NAD(P)-dependent dehydrogenase (short-subunit alcohol dehydrogenase family)
VERILQKVRAIASRERKLSGFCIGNTTKSNASGLYFSPIRNTSKLVAGSAIVYRARDAIEIARAVDGKVDYILVDSEKKVAPDPETFGSADLGNVEGAVRDVVRYSTVLPFKGNDLTVDAVDCLLAQLVHDPSRGVGGKKVAVIGAGNLGFKLALRLVERGAHVVIARRSKEELDAMVRVLNFVKPAYTAARVRGTTENEEAAADANILIGATNGTAVITEKMVANLAPNALIMDAGKGCLFPEAVKRANELGLTVLRVDIRAGFEGQVAMLLETERIVKTTTGRREIEGIGIVSGGLLGGAGEIVVDNVHRPTSIYGVADGRGDFVRSLAPKQARDVGVIQRYIEEMSADSSGRDRGLTAI